MPIEVGLGVLGRMMGDSDGVAMVEDCGRIRGFFNRSMVIRLGRLSLCPLIAMTRRQGFVHKEC